VLDTLNRVLLGWSNYFSYGTRRATLRGVDRYVYERVREALAYFLRKASVMGNNE
jgi:RNA-directed DNA polymerase